MRIVSFRDSVVQVNENRLISEEGKTLLVVILGKVGLRHNKILDEESIVRSRTVGISKSNDTSVYFYFEISDAANQFNIVARIDTVVST